MMNSLKMVETVGVKGMTRRGFMHVAALSGMTLLASTALAGCSAPARGEKQEVPAVDQQPSADGAASASGKTLVAVFSWSGNTLQVAQRIVQETGGDLFVIEPAQPYSTDYDEVVDLAQREQANDARPELASFVENWQEYSTVFLGYPVWWYDAPQVIKSFLDAHSCSGKTVHPFATSGGSGIEETLGSLRAACSDMTLTEGLILDGSTVSSHLDDAAAWVASKA